MARETTVIDRSPNRLPASLLEKIAKLKEGEVVRIKLNPNQFKQVKMISGTSDNMDVPKHSGMVNRVGSRGIASHWDVLWENQRIPCGFFRGYDGSDNPIFKPLKFNYGQDLFLYGGNPEHEEMYTLLQVHPQYRNRVSGPPPKAWICEMEIAESVSSDAVNAFLAKQKVENRVANLTQTELNILMSPASYGTGFLNRPDATNNTTIARGVLVGELAKQGGMKKISDLLEKMDRCKEVAAYHDFFTEKKLSLVGKDLFDEKGVKIHTFSDKFNGSNAEEQARFIYDHGRDIPAVKEAIEAIRGQKKK